MKNLVILGAGTAGTIMANKLNRTLDDGEWRITVVDQHATHYYQPGFLLVPFGIYERKDVVKSKRDYLPKGVEVEQAAIDRIEPDENRVLLQNGTVLSYDLLIVATGSDIRPEETARRRPPPDRLRQPQTGDLEVLEKPS